MRVLDDCLIIEQPISDDSVLEFADAINRSEIKKVIVENSELGASIVQILLCKKREKDIEVKDDFLEKFFENIAYK